MKKFGQYITEGAPEGDKPKQVKPGDSDYNMVMKMRAKYGIDPTPDGGVDPEAIDQRAVRKGVIKALGSKKFKKDMQDHTVADERLQQIDEAIPLAMAAMAGARIAGGAIARGVGSLLGRGAAKGAFRILGRGGARGILGRAGGMAAKAPGAAFRMAKRNPFTTGTIVGSMLSGGGKNQQQQNTGGGY
jgi:hypothetical protein